MEYYNYIAILNAFIQGLSLIIIPLEALLLKMAGNKFRNNDIVPIWMVLLYLYRDLLRVVYISDQNMIQLDTLLVLAN